MARGLPIPVSRSNAPLPTCVRCAARLRARAFAVALAVLTIAAGPPAGAQRTATEPEIKAAATTNLISFVDWPATAFPSPDAPFIIGVLGQGPIAALLEDFLHGDVWRGRKIVLERYHRLEDARRCHVLFLGRSEHSRWPAVRAALDGRPILTISDAPNFARAGGIVQLVIEQNKLRLTINRGVARAAQLEISSKVLRLAEVLDPPAP